MIDSIEKARRFALAIAEDIIIYNEAAFLKMEGKNYMNSKKIHDAFNEGQMIFKEKVSSEIFENNTFFKVFKETLQNKFGPNIKLKTKDSFLT